MQIYEKNKYLGQVHCGLAWILLYRLQFWTFSVSPILRVNLSLSVLVLLIRMVSGFRIVVHVNFGSLSSRIRESVTLPLTKRKRPLTVRFQNQEETDRTEGGQ